jgi:hypothetical protein
VESFWPARVAIHVSSVFAISAQKCPTRMLLLVDLCKFNGRCSQCSLDL